MAEPKTVIEPLILAGDCLEYLRDIDDASIDAIVTDPPYGLGFMGREWDDLPPGLPWAVECLRVLKPGGHLLAFGGTRTWHRLACAVEDAGFEVRDSIAWLYGSGFPKSHNVGKGIDRELGAEREVIGLRPAGAGPMKRGHVGTSGGGYMGDERSPEAPITAPATPDAERWQGWGTALKPAFEPIVVARKPLSGTVAANVLRHGTGALNIDECRVGDGEDRTNGGATGKRVDADAGYMGGWADATDGRQRPTGGRWPTNVVLDDSQAEVLDQQSGVRPGFSGGGTKGAGFRAEYVGGERRDTDLPATTYGDTGGASRFFPTFRYQAKAPKRERPVIVGEDGKKTAHPTVKPLELMRWLVRLVTPPGGIVLDPFAGSGTTVEAAMLEGMEAWAIESEADYLPLIQVRIDRVMAEAQK